MEIWGYGAVWLCGCGAVWLYGAFAKRSTTPENWPELVVATQSKADFDGLYGRRVHVILCEVRVVLCVLRYRVGAYGDENRLSPNGLDSQVHAHMSRNLQAIEQISCCPAIDNDLSLFEMPFDPDVHPLKYVLDLSTHLLLLHVTVRLSLSKAQPSRSPLSSYIERYLSYLRSRGYPSRLPAYCPSP